MIEVIWSKKALEDFCKLKSFLRSKNLNAAKKAAQTIKTAVLKLQELPNIGKPVMDPKNYRDLYLHYGQAGYIIRYRLYNDRIYIISLRHYREA